MRTEWTGRNPGKDKLRNEMWKMLVEEKIAIGEPYNEIPNYVGAEEAADNLSAQSFWKEAKVVKCNPDDAQIPVRLKALEEDKILYMAVPQLTDEKCFVELTRKEVLKHTSKLEDASSWQGGLKYGKLIAFEEMRKIDVAVVGCVAVTLRGARIGKGGGFADLEFGVLRHFKLIQPDTPIVTTVHDTMIIDDELIPIQKHDTFLTHIATPKKCFTTKTDLLQPTGINWEDVQPDQFAEIPILKKLKAERSG